MTHTKSCSHATTRECCCGGCAGSQHGWRGALSLAGSSMAPVVYARGTGGWSHRSVRPSWILIGMGGTPGAHIRYWSTWDKGEPTPHATSNGTPWVNNCIPNCAQGKESSHHLVVTLSAVRTHNGVRYYSRMTWYTPGYRLYGYRTSTAVLHDSATRDTVPYWH